MARFQLYLLCLFSLLTTPAFAGLFSDDEARQQIQQLEARLVLAESSLSKLEESSKQQTSALIDLQTLIESQSVEIRRLRGENEELQHNLQDAEKRQKDFYVDLDNRLRRFEAGDIATDDKLGGKNKIDDLATENRALEAAVSFYKAERWQNAITAFHDFLNNFPQSANVGNVQYWMGNAYFVLKDYKSSLENYQVLIAKFPGHPKTVETLFNIADCQELLNDKAATKASLRMIIAKYPNTDAANKAKKRLNTIK